MSSSSLALPLGRRLRPVFSLVLLTPLIAEYLLGSLSYRQLPLFPLMALMYGAGALVVREAARRSGRGWPAVLLLGLAYGVIEEGLATQSLFNPHYLGLRLLDSGFIPALGIGGPWTIYVILLHVGWSIAVPVGLVEALFPDQRTAPWLGKAGLAVAALVFALGVALIALGTYHNEHFLASRTQLGVSAAIALALTIATWVLIRPDASAKKISSGGNAPRPLVIGALGFVAGSLFHLVSQFEGVLPSPWCGVALLLALPAVLLVAVRRARGAGDWTDAHTDALMLGGLFAYCWLGFFLTARLHGVDTVPGQLIPCAIVLAIVGRRFGRRQAKGK